MSGGVSAATVASYAAIAGAALGAVGTIEQGKASAQSGKYNAEVASNNATIANQNATFAGQEGEANAATSQAKTKAEVGGILASQGASGLDVNSGSDVNVRASASETGMLDAQDIRSNAARQAYGFQTQSSSYGAQSKLDTMQGQNAETASLISAPATVLGEGAKGYSDGTFDALLSSNSLPSGN